VELELERRNMVQQQLGSRGIRDSRVLDAMSSVPRELFIPERDRWRAYQDEPVPIGGSQSISQPYMVARMAELLELQGLEKVLEVGAGSGYHAAVLGRLAREVIAIELLPELAARARAALAEAGCPNVRVVCGDGSMGLDSEAPFDAISVAAAAPVAPRELLAQLAEGGRLVIPVGSREEQELYLYRRESGRFPGRPAGGCRFVPLRGARGW
jgi:protein-L-isoaspartate(D-aspartate) O-methyltransferase